MLSHKQIFTKTHEKQQTKNSNKAEERGINWKKILDFCFLVY